MPRDALHGTEQGAHVIAHLLTLLPASKALERGHPKQGAQAAQGAQAGRRRAP